MPSDGPFLLTTNRDDSEKPEMVLFDCLDWHIGFGDSVRMKDLISGEYRYYIKPDPNKLGKAIPISAALKQRLNGGVPVAEPPKPKVDEKLRVLLFGQDKVKGEK